jgi:hypothetical protein
MNTKDRAMTDEVTPQWTHTPPTKAGWYWMCKKQFHQPKLAQVFAAEGKDGKPSLRYSFHESPMSNSTMPIEDVSLWWFGPAEEPPRKPE